MKMWAEFRYSLRRLRGRIIGWIIGLGLYSLMMVFMYDTVLEIMVIEGLLAAYPPEMMAFAVQISLSAGRCPWSQPQPHPGGLPAHLGYTWPPDAAQPYA
jgi:hypothetical protein